MLCLHSAMRSFSVTRIAADAEERLGLSHVGHVLAVLSVVQLIVNAGVGPLYDRLNARTPQSLARLDGHKLMYVCTHML